MRLSYRVWVKVINGEVGRWAIFAPGDDMGFKYALYLVRRLDCPWRIERRHMDFATTIDSVVIAQSK